MTAIQVTTCRLDDDVAEALLAKHHVGSMAIAFHDRVTIALVNYVYAERWIYGRSRTGRISRRCGTIIGPRSR